MSDRFLLARPCVAVLAVLGAACVAGCATSGRSGARASAAAATHPNDDRCERLLDRFDHAVAQAGVGDAEAARVRGFAWLRVDRFLASFARDPIPDAAATAWVDAMVERAADARRIELANLPQAERAALGDAAAGLADCAQRLRRRDLATSQAWTELHEAAQPPDAYDDGLRIAGLYPVAALPASIGIRRYERATRDAFAVALAELPVHGVLRSYTPAHASTLDALEPAAILAR